MPRWTRLTSSILLRSFRSHQALLCRNMGGSSSKPYTGYNPAEDPVDTSEIEGCSFPYENIVLEGGGAKACAYAGAVEVLEKAGIMKNIKRIAGTSGGAVTGTLIALGCTAEEVNKYFQPDWSLFADARLGWLSYPWNLWRHYGCNPGDEALKVIRAAIADKLGDPKYADITFKELYDLRKVELCIVATNLSSVSIQYFHPKTTPTASVCEAVRMSISIPVYMQPYFYKYQNKESYFCDGGVLCNYPIHVFDGWFLSMKKEDAFFCKLKHDNKRWFEGYNDKTIGICLYELGEDDKMGNLVHQSRPGVSNVKRPDTKLARERGEQCNELLKQLDRKAELLKAIDVLIQNVRKFDDGKGYLNTKEMVKAYKNSSDEVVKARQVVYGEDYTDEKFVAMLKKTKEWTFDKFIDYVSEQHGINFNDLTESANFKEIDSMTSYVSTIMSTWMMSGANRFNRDYDAARTVGVCTDYIRTMDLGMDQLDLAFIQRQAKCATFEFLKYYKEQGPVAFGVEQEDVHVNE